MVSKDDNANACYKSQHEDGGGNDEQDDARYVAGL